MKRKITVCLSIVMIIAAAVMIFCLVGSNKTSSNTSEGIKTVTGMEWLAKQESVLSEYEELAKGYEDVYALYISGAMSPDDFVNELTVCQAELFSIQQEYTAEKSEIRIEMSTESEREGILAFEDLFTSTNDMFVSSVKSGKPYEAEEIGYIYLNYKNVIEKDLETYVMCLGRSDEE